MEPRDESEPDGERAGEAPQRSHDWRPHDVIRRDDPEHMALVADSKKNRQILEGYWNFDAQPPVWVPGLLGETHELKETVQKILDLFANTIKWGGRVVTALLTAILIAVILSHPVIQHVFH